MENKFDKFSYEERMILKKLLEGKDPFVWDESADTIKKLNNELNSISQKEVFKNYDWEIIGWNDEQENIVIPLSQKNAGLFLKVLNVKLQRNRI
jgi:hypothetical protein